MPQPTACNEDKFDGKQRAAQFRRDALVRSTREQIMEHGPNNVRLAEILRLAGGSKATVVKYFGDREGLIAAAITETAQEAMHTLELEMPARSLTLEEGLSHILTGLLRFYLLPETLTVYRGVIAAAGTPLATSFYANGHQVIVSGLASLLQRLACQDACPSTDWEAAAGQLTHMLRSGVYEQALIGLIACPIDEVTIAAHAGSTAKLFLRGALARD